MQKFTFSFLVLIISFSAVSSAFLPATQYNSLTRLSHINPDNNFIDQDIITNEDVFTGSLALLGERISNQSYFFNSTSNDPAMYTGIAGGLAGIGLTLLETRKQSSTSLSTAQTDLLLDLAIAIGDRLNQSANVNSTHATVPVSSTNSSVDLTYDFGISGVLAFYVELYNQTADINYQTLSDKYLTSLVDLTDNGDDFNTFVADYLFENSILWYPRISLELSYVDGAQSYTGIGYGASGVAQSLLAYLVSSNNDQQVVAEQMLNNTIDWITSNFLVTGTNRSISVSPSNTSVVATGIGDGVAGVLDLFIDLFDWSGNQTFETYAEEMINWLNGSSSTDLRYTYSWEVNNLPFTTATELGLSHGVAGITKTLIKAGEVLQDASIMQIASNSSIGLVNRGQDDGIYNKYGIRSINGETQALGSTSRSYGSGGIFEVLSEAASKFNNSFIEDKAKRTKTYLLSQAVETVSGAVIKSFATGMIEDNPSIGFVGALYYLFDLIPGVLDVPSSAVDFGDVPIGTTMTETVQIRNIGEQELNVSWSFQGTTVFFTENNSVLLGGASSYELEVSFASVLETEFTTTMSVQTKDSQVDVLLTANSFDLPQLSIVDAPDNQTTITETAPITFDIEVTDISGVQGVSFSVDNDTEQMSQIPNSNRFNTSWVPDLVNGTYEVVIRATDNAGNTNQLTLQYTIAIYTQPPLERIFSTETLIAAVVLILILIGVAVVLNRRYRN